MFTFLAAAALFAGSSMALGILDEDERRDPDVNRFARIGTEAAQSVIPQAKTVIETFTLDDFDETDAAYVAAFMSADTAA